MQIRRFLLFTFACSWSFFCLAAFTSAGSFSLPFPFELLIVLGAFGPSLSAFSLIWWFRNTKGVTALIRKAVNPRFSISVYFFVATAPLVVSGLAYFLTGGRSPALNFTLPIHFVLFFFLGGSVGEEFGWRGFLLPELLKVQTPLVASLVLGVFWAAWHLPLFFVKGTSQYVTPFPIFFLFIIGLSVQYTWVFLKTNGNLFACLLLHTFTNIIVRVFPYPEDETGVTRLILEAVLNIFIAFLLVILSRRLFFARPMIDASAEMP